MAKPVNDSMTTADVVAALQDPLLLPIGIDMVTGVVHLTNNAEVQPLAPGSLLTRGLWITMVQRDAWLGFTAGAAQAKQGIFLRRNQHYFFPLRHSFWFYLKRDESRSTRVSYMVV